MNYMPYLEQLLSEMQNLLHPELADDARGCGDLR
jgi:hypothetical protein